MLRYSFLVVIILGVFGGLSAVIAQPFGKRKIPSISYTNILSCFPEFKNPNMEFDVDLTQLRNAIDLKYPSLKSTMRYRKVIFEDYKKISDSDNQVSEGISTLKTSNRKRMTLSLVHIKKGIPEYRMSLEILAENNLGEGQSLPKAHEFNPSKEVIKSYLINTKIEEDESFWVDTKPNKFELSYKLNKDLLIEMDFYDSSRKRQLRCDKRKDQSVLCLCLKR